LVWILVGLAAFFLLLCIIPTLAYLMIPNFSHMKKQTGEAAAIQSIRAIQQAELMYSVNYPSHGYACSLRALGGEATAGQPSAETAQILPNDLASGIKYGYIFTISNCARVNPHNIDRVTGYTITAVPMTPGNTGNRGFCSDESGAIKYDPMGGTNCTQPLELR